jgi:N-acetylglucosaminyl-diphospho-decaprenol L-rhamnosyltransferase
VAKNAKCYHRFSATGKHRRASATVPRISILIVNYDAYPALERCLASVAQFAPRCEVVIVDHGTDAGRLSGAIQGHGVRMLADPTNPGFARGVNRAAKAATGDWFLVLNPDCLLESPAPDQLVAWLNAHRDFAVAGPLVHEADGTPQASARQFPDWTTFLGGRSSLLTRWWPDNPLARRNLRHGTNVPAEVDWVSGACLLVRRAAFEDVGGFDEGFFLYWEDADLCRRLRDRGWKTAYCPTAHVRHEGGHSSRRAPFRSLLAFHRSAFRYFWKHGSPFARLLTPAVVLALGARLAIRGTAVAARAFRAGRSSDP